MQCECPFIFTSTVFFFSLFARSTLISEENKTQYLYKMKLLHVFAVFFLCNFKSIRFICRWLVFVSRSLLYSMPNTTNIQFDRREQKKNQFPRRQTCLFQRGEELFADRPKEVCIANRKVNLVSHSIRLILFVCLKSYVDFPFNRHFSTSKANWIYSPIDFVSFRLNVSVIALLEKFTFQ